ncbi:MAG: hypothetical protein LBQ78_00265 [Tannerellaceae bacterium]|jgi:uncharacterized membrane protein|nr:hypothetical protein [Tannerellaceae bacterium]
MEVKNGTTLDFSRVLTDGFEYGMKNIPSLLGALVLWLLTIWIPYVNVGTTIAISTLPLQLSRGTVFSPFSIFDKKYYRYIGEYFLTAGLVVIGSSLGLFFLLIPGITISIAWSLAILLLLDKGLNPTEAISVSNKLTYGNKWTIFLVMLMLGALYLLAITIFAFVFSRVIFLYVLFLLALTIIFVAFSIGVQASIYGTLSKNLEQQ